MTVGRQTVRLVVSAGPDADAEETAELLRRLRAEVADLDADVLADPAGEVRPSGAKGGDPVSVGSLLIVLAASGGVLTSLVGLLQSWLVRNRAQGVVVEIAGDRIEISAATPDERARLIAAWLSRHETTPGATVADEE